MQLGQEDGWQGLDKGRQLRWKGHHCSSRGQEGGSLLLVSLGTQTATGEHAGPPQPDTQDVSCLNHLFLIEFWTSYKSILSLLFHLTKPPNHHYPPSYIGRLSEQH